MHWFVINFHFCWYCRKSAKEVQQTYETLQPPDVHRAEYENIQRQDNASNYEMLQTQGNNNYETLQPQESSLREYDTLQTQDISKGEYDSIDLSADVNRSENTSRRCSITDGQDTAIDGE